MTLNLLTASCVRACAIKNSLLSSEEWGELSAKPRVASAIEWLKDRGVMAEGISELIPAERSAHDEIIRHTSGLIRFARGNVGELLRCFVNYYDLLNIKSVIYRIHTYGDQADAPDIRFYNTGIFGLFTPAALGTIANIPALNIALKRSFLAKPFAEAVQVYRDDDDVAGFVERIEFAFFCHWISAAKMCGINAIASAHSSALSVFFTAKVIDAAVRLKMYRKAEDRRIAKWLRLVAPEQSVEKLIAVLGREGQEDPARNLAEVLVSKGIIRKVDATQVPSDMALTFLDKLIKYAALSSSRGISINAEFLVGTVLRQMCQAKELTMTLESREIEAVEARAGGNR